MATDQETKPQSEQPQGSTSPPAVRRGRHSSRGRRGRGGRRPPPQRQQAQERQAQAAEFEPLPDRQRDEREAAEALSPATQSPPPERPAAHRETPISPGREHKPASAMSVQQAIEEVNQVIDSLRESLDDMEEVLETLELAERQKSADEHEIESLRRALRQLQRPRQA